MVPYCIDLSYFIQQLPESLSCQCCDGCSTPPPQAHLQHFFTHVCMCACACVCVKKSVCVCHILRNSAEICVAIRESAKTGDLGRVVCGFLGCYCVHDKCCPLTPLASADISHDASDHVCVHVWLPVCLCMSITTTYTGEHCNWCRVVQL